MMGSCEVLPREGRPRSAEADGFGAVGRGFLWMLVGHGTYMLCQWGMFVVLARLGSPEIVGRFAIALATSAPIILFTNMGLRRILATDAKSLYPFGDYLGLRLATNLVALGLVGLVVWTSGFRLETVGVVLAMGLSKAVEATIDIIHGLFQKQGRMDLIARSLLLRGPLALTGLTIGLLTTRDVFWGVVGMGAGMLVVLLLYDGPRAAGLAGSTAPEGPSRGVLPLSPSRNWGLLTMLALPLAVVALLASLRWSIPSFVILKDLDEGWLGLFTALAYFHAASNRIVYQLGEAGAARLAKQYADGQTERFAVLLSGMLIVALAISAGGLGIALLAGRPLLSAFYGPPYAAQSAVLVGLMAAAGAANLQTILDFGMTATRHLKIQPVLYGGSALLLFLLCAGLVPSKGLQGATLALGGVALLETVASAAVVGYALLRRRDAETRAVLEER